MISLPAIVGATEDHSQSAADVLAEILESQTISQISNVDCQKITEEQLEELGDAVMEQRHPGIRHTVMDQMMGGGEGSEKLRSMHITMGQNYLGCNTSNGLLNSGMMGGGMMRGFLSSNTFGVNNGFGMSFFLFGFVVTTLLLWVLLVLGIIALIKWIKNKK